MNAATQAVAVAARPRGGRPSRADAALLRQRILDAATELMLDQGYGATSIEAIAARAGVSKRTLYHRFADKAELVQAVVARIVDGARAGSLDALPKGLAAREALRQFGVATLRAALQPQVLALYRLIISESGRFPDLLRAVSLSGGRAQAVRMLAPLLRSEWPRLRAADADFAAQQYLQLLVSLPQLRAMGIGEPMDDEACRAWVDHSLQLLLQGLRGLAGEATAA